MNSAEKKIVDKLRELREKYHVIGIKTELEVEGARVDDLFRQKEITMMADLPITLKIGGCEAVSDMSLARLVGVGSLVAPMIESAFALKKFVGAAQRVFDETELTDMHLLINVETASGSRSYDEMLALPEFGALGGLAIGRKDFAMSLGLGLKDVDSDAVLEPCRELIRKSKAKNPGMHCVIGGISGEASLKALRTIDGLDAYETRKVVFSAEALNHGDALLGLKKGLELELLWYETKSAYYRAISSVDDGYINRIRNTVAAL